MKKIIIIVLILLSVFFIANNGIQPGNDSKQSPDMKSLFKQKGSVHMRYRHITISDSIWDVMSHPAFKGQGKLLFPWDDDSRYSKNMTMYDVPSLLLWHTNMDVQEMVNGVNRLIDDVNDGKQVIYDFYTEEEKINDPSKKQTCLFFFRGKPGAPFAIVCPGGGFYYVGSLHEGFPVAMEINKKGYNAFVLKYRVGHGERVASEDLITAVDFVLKHAREFEIESKNYSIWGFSAGARMCSNVCYGEAGFKRSDDLLHPVATIIAYTYFAGDPDFSADDPAVFLIVGTDDWIVPWEKVEERAKMMKAADINVECRILKGVKHGFGTGRGTTAEGWIDDAIEFWKKQMKK